MRYCLAIVVSMLLTVPAQSQQALTVYIFMAEDCPVCNYLGKGLKKLSSDYDDEVKFVAVFPQRRSHIKSASLFKKKYGLSLFEIEIDHDRKITDLYEALVTPEAVVVDSHGSIVYQGRIDNSYAAPGRMRHGRVTEDLRVAIEVLQRGGTVDKPWPEAVGCYITKR